MTNTDAATKQMNNEKHYINRVGWLRAGVLGANDGILSTTSLVIGVAAATAVRDTIILTALSGLIAGAMSMAAGEYVSVSSQEDTEKADIAREKAELQEMPEQELQEIIAIYKNRGLNDDLAHEVAVALTKHNALETHLRDELGMTEISAAKPLQAALSSFAAFLFGALLPLAVSIFAPLKAMIFWQYGCSIIFLMFLGALAAKTGGAPLLKSMGKICFWGTIAMATTALIGHLFGTHVS
ncbi:VIT family protein [Mucilaginibacter sp. CSA2-8R]|uniref:VIT1/CCC1 transporter family protein n=1 Tax=Mucilaginibacter sp. CSA2-8R TaxID=3141542 RepID=UPI00315C53F2